MKLAPVIASFALVSAAPSALAAPVCYIDMHGVRTDLSYMCGRGEVASTPVVNTSVVSAPVQHQGRQAIFGETEVIQDGLSVSPSLAGDQLSVRVFNRYTSQRYIVSELQVRLTNADGATLHTAVIDTGGETLYAQETETYTQRVSSNLASRVASVEVISVDAFVNPF